MRSDYFGILTSAGNKRSLLISICIVAVSLLTYSSKLWGQDSSNSPASKLPTIKILKGTVESIEMKLGQGPALMLLKEKNETRMQVQLGPVRFLIQKGFNIAVDDQIEVRGWEVVRDAKSLFVASEVRNLTQKQSLQLRDEQFRPLWRGGPFGRGRQRSE